MGYVDQKTERLRIDGTPEKRMYWSIISDYNFRTAITELIDNAIDLWLRERKKKPLLVDISIDCDRQMVTITDNAGGVAKQDLRLLVAPGGSNNGPMDTSIGVFGVGSKRAVVALAEMVSIKTRNADGESFQLDVTDEWLQSESWEMPVYEIPEIASGYTEIQLSRLRKPVSKMDVEDLRGHLGETYVSFINPDRCAITVNGKHVDGMRFDTWAYPPECSPASTTFNVYPDEVNAVLVTITCGLIRDRDPIRENYGAYIFCNDRLIVKEWRSRDVGYYVSSEAGVPHPDASLCRAIVEFAGPARLMPWNSSKTGVNTDHPAFLMARPTITKFIGQFTKISRALKKDWDALVFAYDEGEISEVIHDEAPDVKKLMLPPIPRSRRTQVERLRAANADVIENLPWTAGLVEAMAAVDIVVRQRLETRNRIALILLDSNFEIALKEYIVHDPILSQNLNLPVLFKDRPGVIAYITKTVKIDPGLLSIAKHYYEYRNKLIHEKATFGITDEDVQRYRTVISRILEILFGLKTA